MSTKKQTSARTSGSARPVGKVKRVRAQQSNSPFRAQGLADELLWIIACKEVEARTSEDHNRNNRKARGYHYARGFYAGELFALHTLREAIIAQERKQARARNDPDQGRRASDSKQP